MKPWISAFGGEIRSTAVKYSGSQLLQKKHEEYEKDVATEAINALQVQRTRKSFLRSLKLQETVTC